MDCEKILTRFGDEFAEGHLAVREVGGLEGGAFALEEAVRDYYVEGRGVEGGMGKWEGGEGEEECGERA